MSKLYYETEDFNIFPVQIDNETHLLNSEGTVLQPELLRAVLNGVSVSTEARAALIVDI